MKGSSGRSQTLRSKKMNDNPLLTTKEDAVNLSKSQSMRSVDKETEQQQIIPIFSPLGSNDTTPRDAFGMIETKNFQNIQSNSTNNIVINNTNNTNNDENENTVNDLFFHANSLDNERSNTVPISE